MEILRGFFIILLIASVCAFGGSEDKFLKKYAMMKIYESCFGPDVVRQIRKEMKEACLKCAALEKPEPQSLLENNDFNAPKPNFDIDKLHQTILAYRPNSPPSSFYRPYYPSSPGMAAPFYSLPYSNPVYQNPMFYPGFQQQQPQPVYGGFPLMGQQFYGNRASRDMNIKDQLEALTSRMSGKVRNITCVMQELGYLDEQLEPNYQKINERIARLPVEEELKKDIQDGAIFCQQFSQCVPEVKKDKSPLSRELIRPMFFFKCYKHKKLEACIMKDVREKYAGASDDDFMTDLEFRRTGKASESQDDEKNIENLATSLYDFLYGTESNINVDEVL